MSHFHGTELQEGLAQCYTTEEQLPVLKGKKDHEYTTLMTLNLEATLVSFHGSYISQVVSLNKSYIHFGKLQPKEGLVVTGENVSGNSMLNNVLRDCHHLFFVCYLFFHFSGFFRKKFIPSPITHPDNIIHQCSNA